MYGTSESLCGRAARGGLGRGAGSEHLRHLLPVWGLAALWGIYNASAAIRQVTWALNVAFAAMGAWMWVASPVLAPLDAALWERANAVWWLASTAPSSQAQKKRTFAALFPTEETLYLFY